MKMNNLFNRVVPQRVLPTNMYHNQYDYLELGRLSSLTQY